MRTEGQGAGGFGRKSENLFVPEDFLPLCHPQGYLESWSFWGKLVLSLGILSGTADIPVLGEVRQPEESSEAIRSRKTSSLIWLLLNVWTSLSGF